MDRFWSKVSKRRSGCWEWTAGTVDGYGRFRLNGKSVGAHRVAWFLTHGSMPEGPLLHRCDNKLCVNPAHTYEGDHQQNWRDLQARGSSANQKLTADDRAEIVRLRSAGLTQAQIAERFGVHRMTVIRILRGRR